MKIDKVSSVSFQRKPTAKEMKVYTSSVQKGLSLLNKKVDIILHNASAPSVRAEDTGIGSLFSATTTKKLMPFLRAHAITGIQQEPNGYRSSLHFCPYALEASSKNILMFPLKELTKEKYGKILSNKTFNEIVNNNPNREYVNYEYVSKGYDRAFREAYENFKNGNVLKSDFKAFKKKNGSEIEKYAIFHILDKHYQKEWTMWDGIDKKLYAPATDEEIKAASKRIKEIKAKYKDEIDFYIFQQMLLEKENAVSNKLTKDIGITIIGDSPVATPVADEWINQSLFMDGMALGCPPDFFSPDGQRWNFRYFNPHKIFNEDGSLGEAGILLKKEYEDYFASFPGGIRIDHTIGLVDPFLYTVESAKMTPENSGRIYSQEFSEFKKNSIDEYANILTKIIIPAAEKFGIEKSNIICEDLGEPNFPTIEVMKKLDLSGIAVTQFGYRGAEVPQKNVIMLGSHDNSSYLEYTDEFFKNKESEDFLTKTEYLMEDTSHKDATEDEKKWYLGEIRGDKKKFLSASFAELFTSPAKRVQIFFTDLFGIPKTYNRPGTTEGNWSLRLPETFEEDYYKAVSEGKAPNFAHAIATALRQRGLNKGNEKLLEQLDSSARILAEA